MKRSILAGSFLMVTLVQGLAHAQMMDLPDPGGDMGGPTQVTPTPDVSTPSGKTQFAGSLRLGSLSRKTGGTLYKVDFSASARLQRLDVRVSANRVKIYQTNLVTASGYKIAVNQLSNTAVIATSSVLSSENFSLNENISSVEILMEAYDGEADIVLTAISDTAIPKLSLRKEVKPPEPVVVTPTPDVTPNYPVEPLEPYNPDGGSVIYYGRFRIGDRVLYRDQHVAVVRDIYDGDRVLVKFETGYSKSVFVSELTKAVSAGCIEGLCKGDFVLYNGGYEAQVVDVFNNGFIQIQLRGFDNRRFVTSSYSLQKMTRPQRPAVSTMECTRDRRFCLGDRVMYDGYVVTIESIYSDGTALVVDAAGEQTVPIRSLREVPRRRW